jgi:trehalose 6-phosphate phosphatase
MQYLLSGTSRGILEQLARDGALCAFDFDGTLAPIVEHPDQAGMRVRTRDLLGRLAALYPCVIVSGRARADVLSKLGALNLARVIGNHGAETEGSSPNSREQVGRWKAALERQLGSLPGLWMEDKGISLAVHYRQSPHKAEARRLVLAAARTLPDVRVFGGKQVVNLVPVNAPHKGDALAAERARVGCKWVLFVGDDENDEDAFALAGNVVPVSIGRKQQSHARYYLRTQAEIDDLLDLLVRLRNGVARHEPCAPSPSSNVEITAPHAEYGGRKSG